MTKDEQPTCYDCKNCIARINKNEHGWCKHYGQPIGHIKWGKRAHQAYTNHISATFKVKDLRHCYEPMNLLQRLWWWFKGRKGEKNV